MVKQYDYLIVGAGLFGAIFACEAKKRGKRCLVLDKRKHCGGNIYCEDIEGIHVHKYGAHIFHTDNKEVWDYVNRLVEFNRFTNSPLACFKGELYNLPFNMNTFYQLWKVKTPAEAKAKIETQRKAYNHISDPVNLEEQALKLCGEDIYNVLIKGYTEKQWGRGIEVRLGVDYFKERSFWDGIANKILFTGCIDEFFDYQCGQLEYRSLRFEQKMLEIDDFQGNAVVNYTEREIPYTRIIEHKHFEFGKQPVTVITYEYPDNFELGKEPYYPINDKRNMDMFKRYQDLAQQKKNVLFGGRLAQYTYADMDDTVEAALNLVKKEFVNE